MTASKGATSFFNGFATAASWLGTVLAVLWLALWGLEAAGGPALGMPIEVFRSAGVLLIIGTILRLLLRSRAPVKETA